MSDGILSTTYKRKSYFLHNPNFYKVKPVEYCAGIRGGLQRFYTYIPVLEVLTQLLNHDKVLLDILHVVKPVPNLFKKISDGQFFHKNKLFSSPDLTLQLQLYMDEIELCTPIVSYKKAYIGHFLT